MLISNKILNNKYNFTWANKKEMKKQIESKWIKMSLYTLNNKSFWEEQFFFTYSTKL